MIAAGAIVLTFEDNGLSTLISPLDLIFICYVIAVLKSPSNSCSGQVITFRRTLLDEIV